MLEPTYISYRPNGSIRGKVWQKDGKLHRLDGPARIRYHFDNVPEAEEWFFEGQLHRIDGPARIRYFSDGELYEESWFQCGEYHREVFPSKISYLQNNYFQRKYYNRGRNITDQVKDYLEENKLFHQFKIPLEHQLIMKMKFW